MQELLGIKKFVEIQIGAATDMLEYAKSEVTGPSEYIKYLETKIEAWEQTLEFIKERIDLMKFAS